MEEYRTFVVAPTRATCETLKVLLEVEEFPTRLMKAKGKEILKLVRKKKKFGIIAGTGSGKSASIKSILKEEYGVSENLRVDIVTREYEATWKTWQSNVIVITPGIALIWAKYGVIKKKDEVIFDEIHQTSEHLELTEALALYIGCRTIWMSATVDARTFAEYLESDKVIIFDKVEENKKAKITLIDPERESESVFELIQRVIAEKRGMVMFLPTRRETEEYADMTQEAFGNSIKVEFYHGGEPAEKLRPYLNRGIANKNRPFVVFMTNAGQSGLNIEGLSVVVARDECISEEFHNGMSIKTKTFLSINDLLQMLGRVNGRVTNAEGYIITSRKINFHALKPQRVKFVLGHSLERLALVCGRLAIDLSLLKLPEPVNRKEYSKVVRKLIKRNIFEPDGINLTDYGKKIERIPSSVAWAEIISHSPPETLCAAAICAASSGLYRTLKVNNDIFEFVSEGSDHLTMYNIAAYAITHFGEVSDSKGYTEYNFRKEELEAWAEEKGINSKEIEEIALALKSILHNLGMPLVEELPQADKKMTEQFTKLLAQTGSLNIVFNECDLEGNYVATERFSVCQPGGFIIGTVSGWREGDNVRRAIEGTQVDEERYWRLRRNLNNLQCVRQ